MHAKFVQQRNRVGLVNVNLIVRVNGNNCFRYNNVKKIIGGMASRIKLIFRSTSNQFLLLFCLTNVNFENITLSFFHFVRPRFRFTAS